MNSLKLKYVIEKMRSEISKEKYSYVVPEHLLLNLIRSMDLRDLFSEIFTLI